MWYSFSVALARFFSLPAVTLVEEGASPSMRPRRAALLTEHAAKHAHPERASRAEGSLFGATYFPSKTVTFSPTIRPHKSFSGNTYGSPRKYCKQKTYAISKSFSCNTYKKHGGGALVPTRAPRRSEWCVVRGEFTPRGGLSTSVFARWPAHTSPGKRDRRSLRRKGNHG